MLLTLSVMTQVVIAVCDLHTNVFAQLMKYSCGALDVSEHDFKRWALWRRCWGRLNRGTCVIYVYIVG